MRAWVFVGVVMLVAAGCGQPVERDEFCTDLFAPAACHALAVCAGEPIACDLDAMVQECQRAYYCTGWVYNAGECLGAINDWFCGHIPDECVSACGG